MDDDQKFQTYRFPVEVLNTTSMCLPALVRNLDADSPPDTFHQTPIPTGNLFLPIVCQKRNDKSPKKILQTLGIFPRRNVPKNALTDW